MKRQSITGRWFLAVVAWAATAGPLAAGHYLEQKVSSSDNGMNMEVRAWADGESAKVEFTRSDSEFIPSGSYLLTTDGGQTVYLVDPAARTYSVWDMDALFATLGQALEAAQGVVELDFKDVMAEDLGSESGGEMLGYDTTKKSWRTGYTMDMKVVFMKQSQRMDTTTEAWMTDAIDNSTLGMWFTVQPPTTGNPDLDMILTQSMEQIDGTPLKVVQHTTMTDNKKKRRGGKTTTTTMEVTAFREESVDAGVFTMPEGLTETPLIPALGGQTGEEDGPLKGLGGLFGGKKKRDG